MTAKLEKRMEGNAFGFNYCMHAKCSPLCDYFRSYYHLFQRIPYLMPFLLSAECLSSQ